MAVVRNLMVRIGADYSTAQKGMQGAKRSLDRFKTDAERTTKKISGNKGLGGASEAIKDLGADVTKTTAGIKGNKGLKGIGVAFTQTSNVVSDSIARMRGTNGIGGIVQELGALRNASGSAGGALTTLGTRAAGASSRLVVFATSLGAAIAILGIAIKALHDFAQPAAQFESAIGRVNMSLKQGSSDYLKWAKSMGIAKSSAAEMGATYGVLLSSFIKDNSALTQSTKDIVQATRVVSSATGRTIEDTLERMRSGLLGNTEAIEDLGIFVNVSMIESTNAFKKFANGKSWDQLNFQVQQQIRLAAILEQTYARYGNQLQNNVLTKQSGLMEQLKDIKLHLSQAFLPIWDAVLPALTKMAEGIAWLTEQIARFAYWVAGEDYDEATQGLNNQTEAVEDQSKAYDDLAKDAKKARKELASFDQLNLLGSPSGSSGGKSSGSNGGWKTPNNPPKNEGDKPSLPILPTPPTIRGRLIFDPPFPPDAGAGAVATTVAATVNALNALIKLRFADLWSNLQTQSKTGFENLRLGWEGFTSNVAGVILPKFVVNVGLNWSNMFNGMKSTLGDERLNLQTGWSSMLDLLKTKLTTEGANILTQWGNALVNMRSRLVEERPKIQTEWQNMFDRLRSTLVTEGTNIATNWSSVLSTMVSNLAQAKVNMGLNWDAIKEKINSVKEPLSQLKNKFVTETATSTAAVFTFSVFVASQFGIVSDSISKLKSPLESMKESFSSTLSSLNEQVNKYLTPVIVAINATKVAWNQLKTAFGGKVEAEQSQTQSGISGEAVIAGSIAAGSTALAANWNKMLESLKSLGKSLSSSAGSILGPIDAVMGHVYDEMSKEMGWGASIPAMANGGVVRAPTIAMVGDNHNARMNPEIVTPQDIMYSTVQAATGESNAKMVGLLERIARATESGKNVTVQVAESDVGKASANYINREYRRGVNILDAVT